MTCLARELRTTPDLDGMKESLKKNFEDFFGITLKPGGLTEAEKEMLLERIGYFGSEDWINKVKHPKHEKAAVHSVHRASGGTIRVAMAIDAGQGRIQSALITGDFFSFPQRAVLDLEARLKGAIADIPTIRKAIDEFFAEGLPQVPGVQSSDFETAIRKCLDKVDMSKAGMPLGLADRINTVNGNFTDILRNKPRHLLLPYCAKSPECGWRYKTGCIECGECTVGEAYGLARKNGMEAVTIQSFEHLMETLETLRQEQATSYIGCCCEAFYAKHLEDFERSGLPGILLDIDSETCYDLGKESGAYQGKFENLTGVNLDLLKEVLDVKL